MFKLKHNGHANQYWNGKQFVKFNQEGFYETEDAQEAQTLASCFGVSLVEEPKKEVEAPTEEVKPAPAPAKKKAKK